MCLDLEIVIIKKQHPNTKRFKRTLIYYNTDTHYEKQNIKKKLLSRLTTAKPGGPGVVEEAWMSVPQRRSV